MVRMKDPGAGGLVGFERFAMSGLLPLLLLASDVMASGITTNSWTSINRWRYGGFGSPFSSRANANQFKFNAYESWSPIWTQTGIVPEKLSQVPPGKLLMDYPQGIRVRPNDTISTGLLWHRPRLSWRTSPGKLYSVIIVDTGIAALQGAQYFHWGVTNIPGNDIGAGAEVMEYIPPFQASPSDPGHPMLALVYEQPGPIVVMETQQGCTEDIGSSRIGDQAEIAAKYGLRLVAGNFLLTTGGGSAVDELLCKFTRCMGQPFPAPLPGVNDLPACQKSDLLMDTTFRGPQKGKEDSFYRVFSPLIEVSIPTAFGKYPGVSNIRDFQVINGLFDAPAGLRTNEQETGSGEMQVYFANYKPEAYPAVFQSPAVGEALQVALPLMSGNEPFKIIISKADDQDFDLATLLRDFNEVMEVDLVIPNSGQEAQFDVLRKEFIARARNIPGTRVYTFTPFSLVPGLFGQWPGDENNLEMLITVYRDEQTQIDALQSGLFPLDFFEEYFSTSRCVACTRMGNRLNAYTRASYYPDVPRRRRALHWSQGLLGQNATSTN